MISMKIKQIMNKQCQLVCHDCIKLPNSELSMIRTRSSIEDYLIWRRLQFESHGQEESDYHRGRLGLPLYCYENVDSLLDKFLGLQTENVSSIVCVGILYE